MPTLADHATTLADKHGLTKADAKSFAADLFAIILDAAKRGEDTSVPGFGKFAVKHAAARTGRNPATGASLTIPASTRLVFSTAKAAKDALNG